MARDLLRSNLFASLASALVLKGGTPCHRSRPRTTCGSTSRTGAAGRPVVMMHGWPLSADTFDDLAMAVADAGLRAIAYDRRGFGRSDQPWGGYDYDTLADDLGSIINEYVGAQDATLLGFSMGGGEVARYMSRHGGHGVKQAILVASVVPFHAEDRRQSRRASISRCSTAPRRPSRRTAPSSGPDSSRTSTASARCRSPSATRCWSGRVTCRCRQGSTPRWGAPRRSRRPTSGRTCQSFRVPTLIIHGTADKTVPIDTSARQAAAGISGQHAD